ncbi:hypothetical protein KI387_020064, partial [Taxus chinensis]
RVSDVYGEDCKQSKEIVESDIPNTPGDNLTFWKKRFHPDVHEVSFQLLVGVVLWSPHSLIRKVNMRKFDGKDLLNWIIQMEFLFSASDFMWAKVTMDNGRKHRDESFKRSCSAGLVDDGSDLIDPRFMKSVWDQPLKPIDWSLRETCDINDHTSVVVKRSKKWFLGKLAEFTSCSKDADLMIDKGTSSIKDELKGCVNKVKRMYRCLFHRFGFEQENIEVLIDTKETKSFVEIKGKPMGANIKKALKTSLESTQHGDVLFFHYNGLDTHLAVETSDPNDAGCDKMHCSHSYEPHHRGSLIYQ